MSADYYRIYTYKLNHAEQQQAVDFAINHKLCESGYMQSFDQLLRRASDRYNAGTIVASSSLADFCCLLERFEKAHDQILGKRQTFDQFIAEISAHSDNET